MRQVLSHNFAFRLTGRNYRSWICALLVLGFAVLGNASEAAAQTDAAEASAENATQAVLRKQNVTSDAGNQTSHDPASQHLDEDGAHAGDGDALKEKEGKDEDAEGGGSSGFLTFLGAVLAICGAFCLFRRLTQPKGTPPPLLADAELSEGESGGPMSFLSSGAHQARQLMSSEQPPAGFTQF